jgi:hypothetical protein
VVGRLTDRDTKAMTQHLREIVTTIEETGLPG